MKFFERQVTLFDIPLTPANTANMKKYLMKVWEIFATTVSLLSTYLAYKYRTPLPAIPLLLITAYVGYRIYKRAGRRCPHCSLKALKEEEREELKLRRPFWYWYSRMFLGWFIQKRYWREDPPQKLRFSWIILRDYKVCHFHYVCSSCGEDFQIKRPQLKSFGHRRPIVKEW